MINSEKIRLAMLLYNGPLFALCSAGMLERERECVCFKKVLKLEETETAELRNPTAEKVREQDLVD